jgi:hypothetical protein
MLPQKAAAQHASQYLVSSLRLEFLQSGGDPAWLHGLAYAPGKLRRLAELNTILAHQPWRLTPAHIGKLAKADADPETYPAAAVPPYGYSVGSGSPIAENWSMGEMVHAIVLLATFHSLASFSLSCGLVPELDTLGGTKELDIPLLQLPTVMDTSRTQQEAEQSGEVLQQDTEEGVEGLGVSLAPSEQLEQEAHTEQLLSRLKKYWEMDKEAEEDNQRTNDAFETCADIESK